VFEEAYVRALQKNEMIEIQGLKDDSGSEDGSHMLILSEFDIKNKILSFEIFE
jgi:hypothetical protein